MYRIRLRGWRIDEAFLFCYCDIFSTLHSLCPHLRASFCWYNQSHSWHVFQALSRSFIEAVGRKYKRGSGPFGPSPSLGKPKQDLTFRAKSTLLLYFGPKTIFSSRLLLPPDISHFYLSVSPFAHAGSPQCNHIGVQNQPNPNRDPLPHPQQSPLVVSIAQNPHTFIHSS